MKTRMEADSIGTMEVPEEAYYGVQALRAKENFSITGAPMNPVFLENLARIKKAAAITNVMHLHWMPVMQRQLSVPVMKSSREDSVKNS